ncbi:hypothetical protein KSP39_PZI000321 [Platanthera zijinensis]|uniref:Uncharacterized protein n=1 Tax=Platanthera zijinensis TaxID=2320716 RepID=A0AAP0C3R1_9ASPA
MTDNRSFYNICYGLLCGRTRFGELHVQARSGELHMHVRSEELCVWVHYMVLCSQERLGELRQRSALRTGHEGALFEPMLAGTLFKIACILMLFVTVRVGDRDPDHRILRSYDPDFVKRSSIQSYHSIRSNLETISSRISILSTLLMSLARGALGGVVHEGARGIRRRFFRCHTRNAQDPYSSSNYRPHPDIVVIAAIDPVIHIAMSIIVFWTPLRMYCLALRIDIMFADFIRCEHASEVSDIVACSKLLFDCFIPVLSIALLANSVYPGEVISSFCGYNAEEILIRILMIRHSECGNIFHGALRLVCMFHKPYSAKIVSCLPVFVDQVVIEAADMKLVPEFSHLSFNARAKCFIQRSGVVDLVKWLKHNSLTYPQIGKLICLCSTNLEPVRRVAEWLKTIHVKGNYLGYVLVKATCILEHNLEILDGIVDYLEKMGVRNEWMGYVVSRCPKLLTLSMDDIESRVKFYMQMGMDEKDFGTMVYDYPKVLGFFSMEEMNSKVNYLKEFGLATEEVGRVLAYKPQLMGCSIEERWKPLVKYMYYLGLRRDGLKRILMAKPAVFCVDLEKTIAPKVRFLQDIGVRQEDIGSVLARFPSLLTYSLYKKIRPVVIYLLTKAGVTKENIAKVIAFDPQLVGCSILKKLDVSVKYFLSLGIRLHILGEMITDFPMLLRYNLDIIRPKYRYLRRIMIRPLQDLIEFPRFFSYSLEGRIIPRHEILVKNRVNFKLRYMLASSDEEFNRRVFDAVENRRRFESGEMNSDLSSADSHVVSVLAP